MPLTRAATTSLLTAVALAAAVAFTATAAAAQTVTVVGFDGVGVAPALVNEATGGALDGASRVRGLDVTDYTDVSVSDAMQLLGCSEVDDRCMQEFSSMLGSRVVVFGALRFVGGPVLDLTIYDGALARATVRSSLELPSTGVADFVAYHVTTFLSGGVVISVHAGIGEGEAFVDGVPIGSTPAVTNRFTPGPHAISVVFDDGREGQLQVDLATLGRYDLTVAPEGRAGRRANEVAAGPSQTRTPRPPRGPREPVDARRVAGWSAIALGAGAGVTAAVFGARVSESQRAFEDTPLQAEAHALAEEGRSDARITNAAIGAAAVLGVTGVVLLVTQRGDADAEQASRRGFDVAPERGGARAVLRLAF